MKPAGSAVAVDATDEISALIATLHETGQRLEELTAGEVDTVADRAGRPFVLHRAQEQMRHSEDAKQAAILNALPAHIALLDTFGVIVAVNEAWRRFAVANELHSPGHAIGANYLAVCDSARGDDAREAHQAAAGIRSVLGGEAKNFSIEYPCHSPTEQRWFLMTVTPLGEGHRNGAVIMHLNITERRQATEKLRESRQRLDAIVTSAMDAVVAVDEEMRIVLTNLAVERMFGYTAAELEGQPLDLLVPERFRAEHSEHIAVFGRTDVTSRRMGALRPVSGLRKNGEVFPLEASISKDALTGRRFFTAILRDITERTENDKRIRRLNRVYAVLSGINTLIVRVHQRDELFREACRVAVEHGHFKMAWIGIVDRSAMKIVPLASAGAEAEFLTLVKDRFSLREDAPLGHTISARAVREKKAIVSNEIQGDTNIFFAKDRIERGIRSLAILPLLIADEAVGVIALYSGESGFFDAEEMKLLTELADDIAFAIDHIDKQSRLDYLAYYDPLTGLANQTLFSERLQEKLLAARNERRGKAVFLIDIERFKSINDAYGRPAGDALLKQIAGRIVAAGNGDASRFARVGADRFAVSASGIESVEQVGRYLEERLNASFGEPFRVGDNDLRVAVKVGIAMFPDDGADADTLMRNAESALKKAKASGERYLFFTQAMTERVAERLSLEYRLRQALEREEFVLHYQPKINLASGKLTSAEALIRWNDPRTGLVPPGHFIPILEETGMIYEVGRWALKQALADYLRWRAAGLSAVRIAVNVSPLQLRNRGFIAEIGDAIGVDAQAAAGLELEITESVIMDDVRHNIASLQAIRALGVSIAIDDFGTGFSSLSYLAKLPVDALKIDRSFVIEMTRGPQGLALVSTIINLAHALKLKVVAEGVETEEQQRLLRLLDCDEMQGFLFSKPVPGEVFEARFLTVLPAAA
jgi:diguanylate cyclase (GGDEF)-like protein/PAS domain S-box-containing protein